MAKPRAERKLHYGSQPTGLFFLPQYIHILCTDSQSLSLSPTKHSQSSIQLSTILGSKKGLERGATGKHAHSTNTVLEQQKKKKKLYRTRFSLTFDAHKGEGEEIEHPRWLLLLLLLPLLSPYLLLCMDHATPSLALSGKKKKKLRLEEHAAWHTLLKKEGKKGGKKRTKQAGIVAAGEERRQPLLTNGNMCFPPCPMRRLCCAT